MAFSISYQTKISMLILEILNTFCRRCGNTFRAADVSYSTNISFISDIYVQFLSSVISLIYCFADVVIIVSPVLLKLPNTLRAELLFLPPQFLAS